MKSDLKSKPVSMNRPKPATVNLDAFRGFCAAAGKKPVVHANWDIHARGWRINMAQYHLESKNGKERLFKTSDAVINLIEKEIASHCDAVQVEFVVPCNMYHWKRSSMQKKGKAEPEEKQAEAPVA
jgi:hypothetical protein